MDTSEFCLRTHLCHFFLCADIFSVFCFSLRKKYNISLQIFIILNTSQPFNRSCISYIYNLSKYFYDQQRCLNIEDEYLLACYIFRYAVSLYVTNFCIILYYVRFSGDIVRFSGDIFCQAVVYALFRRSEILQGIEVEIFSFSLFLCLSLSPLFPSISLLLSIFLSGVSNGYFRPCFKIFLIKIIMKDLYIYFSDLVWRMNF